MRIITLLVPQSGLPVSVVSNDGLSIPGITFDRERHEEQQRQHVDEPA